MAWTVEYTPKVVKELSKLDKGTAKRIVRFLDERVAGSEDPTKHGKRLSGPLSEFWRYRVGDYRILTKLEDGKLVVLVVEVGHRSTIYLNKK